MKNENLSFDENRKNRAVIVGEPQATAQAPNGGIKVSTEAE